MKAFIFFVYLICFCTGAEYAITRPASNGIFLTSFSAEMIPWVWLFTVPLNWAMVICYNRFLPRIKPLKMALFTGFLIMGVSLLCGWLLPIFPKLIFFHYIWKDIYILFSFKQLWSMIHATISSRSKYLYGIIFGMGTLGSIAGSFLPGLFAVQLGSENLFFFTLPLYAVWILSFVLALRSAEKQGVQWQNEWESKPPLWNRSVLSILVLVVLMQFAVALVEYQFNSHLAMEILEKDLRTQYCGQVFGWTSLVSGALQFLGTFLLVQWLGVRRCHVWIPVVLFVNAAAFWWKPSFMLATFAFIFVKSIDFSLFGIVKEMLYTPLNLDEKYRAKAFIDVFAYRSSKAILSFMILGLQYASYSQLLAVSRLLSLFLFAFWFLFCILYLRFDERKILTH